jgi:hypothetical protein
MAWPTLQQRRENRADGRRQGRVLESTAGHRQDLAVEILVLGVRLFLEATVFFVRVVREAHELIH